MSNLTKYVGDRNGQPFSGNGVMGDYVFDMNGTDAPRFLYTRGDTTRSGWTRKSVQERVDDGSWVCLTVEDFNKRFKPQTNKRMASLTVKKGSLYFNTTSARVERVIAIVDGSLVWTSRHKQEAKAYPRSAFRIANQVEVDNYLNEATAGGN